MKKFKFVGYIYAIGLIWSACNFFIATSAIETSADKQNTESLSKSSKLEANLFAQNGTPIIRFERLRGSTEKGEIITNEDQSLSCSLKSWQLIGIFKDNILARTQGEWVFEITNNSSKSQTFVLPELLILDKRGNALTVSNPHRELQGEFLKFEPPIEKGETREFTRKLSYRSNWHEVKLKTCRWLEKGSEFWEIYPELKDESTL